MGEINKLPDEYLNSAEADTSKVPLKRVLGLSTAILLVAGNMIGTGVFKKIVPMAEMGLSENYILLAWIVAGVVTLLGAFTFAGLAKLTTTSGGNYEYLRLCFGGLPGFLYGWGYFIIMGTGTLAAVSFIFSQSINSLITIPNPLQRWEDISIGNYIFPFANSGIKILSIVVIAILTYLNYLGVKKGAVMNNIITGSKILGILFLIVIGVFFANSTGSTSTAIVQPELQGAALSSIFFVAMLSAFWAYDGFANIGSIAGEIKNPQKNIPIAIITGVSLIMILYVLVNYAYLQSMTVTQLGAIGESKVVAIVVAENILGKSGTIIISILIILSTFGFLNVAILLYSRYYYRMAQEKMFFKNSDKVHPVYRTPHIVLLYSLIWCSVLIISGTFEILTDMIVFGSFVFYILLAYGLIKMKRKKVIKDPIPLYPIAPILFIGFTVVVLANTLIINPARSLTGIGLILSGIPVYYYFKHRNKKDEPLETN